MTNTVGTCIISGRQGSCGSGQFNNLSEVVQLSKGGGTGIRPRSACSEA